MKIQDVRYSPGSVPRVNYRAQFMIKILYFHKKLNVFHLAWNAQKGENIFFTIYDGEGGPQREWLP